VQVNHSVTAARGTVRGLHFQHAPNTEAKLIRCLRGAVFDVAVDLRGNSSTYGHWYGIELSAENERQIFIPEGFAHGFQSLTDGAELLYQHTAPYSVTSEGGVRFDDATIAITWPLAVTAISNRDLALPLLDAHITRIAA
jgi:dTDP-4-dehydrorhamnose 3,5-epimerase